MNQILDLNEMKELLEEFKKESELNKILHDLILLDDETKEYCECWDCALESIIYCPLEIAEGCSYNYRIKYFIPTIKPYEEIIENYINEADKDLDPVSKAFLYFSIKLNEKLAGKKFYA